MLLSRVFPELWKFGTHERATRGTPLRLWTRVLQNAAANRFSTFRLQGAAAGYTVTAGTTLVITRLLWSADAAAWVWDLGSSDADLGLSAAADGANPVFLDSEAAAIGNVFRTLAANTVFSADVYYEITAAKFPRLTTGLGTINGFVQLFGHEV